MKQNAWIVSIIALVLALAVCFAPLISYSISPEALTDAQKDVDKLLGKVEDAQNKLDSLTAESADAKDIKKQQDKLENAKAKYEAELQQYELIQNSLEGNGSYVAVFSAGLPDGLEINNIIVNESGTYLPNLEEFQVVRFFPIALIALALLLTLLGRGKLVSKAMTYASIFELATPVVICYIILRQLALPIKAPYGAASVNPLIWACVALPLVALVLNTIAYRKTSKTLIYIMCVFLSALSLFPFWIMIVNATRNTNQIQQGLSLIPSTYVQNNWRILMGKNFDVMLGIKNSSLISFSSTFLTVYFSALCAYGLVAYDFKGRNMLFSFIVGIIMIPTQVSSIGFYMYMYQIGWTDSFVPLILPAIAAPGTVFFMRQYLQANFQISLVEAARIDGAGEFRTYNQIAMPIMMPALATMGIMAVISSWNNYLTPLMLLKDPLKATLPMMVRTLRGDIYRTEYGSIYLGLALTALPLMVVYFALSKYIIQGVALGGVKE